MPVVRAEEKRYCPTCQKKTIHWISRMAFLSLEDKKKGEEDNSQSLKTECRECLTVL